MQVFIHHIYEYKKGLRNLILHTTEEKYKNQIIKRLEKGKIDYLIYKLGKDKINVFFGNKDCIAVLKQIGKEHLYEYTAEEDFILGTMLGYDRVLQCKRYLKMKAKDLSKEKIVSIKEA